MKIRKLEDDVIEEEEEVVEERVEEEEVVEELEDEVHDVEDDRWGSAETRKLHSWIGKGKHLVWSGTSIWSSCLIQLWKYMSVMFKDIIHSFYFHCASSNPLLLRSAPNTARTLCRSFTPKRHRQGLRVKDFPKVPTWRLEQDSNLQPLRLKAPNLPMSHHASVSFISCSWTQSGAQVFFSFQFFSWFAETEGQMEQEEGQQQRWVDIWSIEIQYKCNFIVPFLQCSEVHIDPGSH